VLALLVVAAFLGLWELYARAGGVDAFILPAPTEVARALVDDRGVLWHNFGVTATEIGLGLLVAIALGILVALMLHLVRPLKRGFLPLLIGSQVVPVPLIAPLLVQWFGFGMFPKLVVIGLVCFFPVAVATLDGLAAADPDQRKLLRSLGASRAQLLRFVEAPGALPRVFTGARVSVAVGAIAAVLAEQAGAEDGLGLVIIRSIPQFETARAWAAVVVLSSFVLLLYAALALLERRLTPWSHHPSGGLTR
jgi:ABC-type nitrate/sulfonate/bicarbonate transport system permease component